MDGISKNPFIKLPDVSTNTMVYTVNAPQDVLNINQDVIDYIHMMDGLGVFMTLLMLECLNLQVGNLLILLLCNIF